ncbi:uncharacterized protein LOC118185790 [Stegodyphus dumicola]|uniref:uncharacterized protein LOC118185790 n=1 Tax=Stegodyphus dumicola TaxID=202533 RepID=UPI0015B0A03D|nr:uncharacterized protein LOC118185790 [Stegodyphus dumicola]
MDDIKKKKKRKNVKICNSKFLKRFVNHLNCENFKHTAYWIETDVCEIRYVHMKSNFFERKVLDLFKDMDRLFGEKYPTNTPSYDKECKVRFKSNMQKCCERNWLEYLGEDKSLKSVTKKKYRFKKYPSGTACKFGEPRLLGSSNDEDFLLSEDSKVQLLPQVITSNQTLTSVTSSTNSLMPLAPNALSLQLEVATSDQNLIPVTIPVEVLRMLLVNILCSVANDQVKVLESSSGDQAEFMDCTSNGRHEFLEPVSVDEANSLRHISDCETGFLECTSDEKMGSTLGNNISRDQTAVPDSLYYQVGLKLPKYSEHSVWMGCLTDSEESYDLSNIGSFLSTPKKEETDEDLEIEKEGETDDMKQNDPFISSAWEDNISDSILSASEVDFTWSLEDKPFM